MRGEPKSRLNARVPKGIVYALLRYSEQHAGGNISAGLIHLLREALPERGFKTDEMLPPLPTLERKET